MNQANLIRSIFFLAICFCLNISQTTVADELVYIFKGDTAVSSNDSHSQIGSNEGFVAVLSIDPSVADFSGAPEIGFYIDAVLSGRIFFAGGHVSPDLAGADLIVENQSTHDSIRVFVHEFLFFEARVEGGGAITNDALPVAGEQFESAPDPATQIFDAFVYSDADGVIWHTSLQANNICFESKTGVAFAHAEGNPWYDLSSTWLSGFNSGPPTATDTIIFDRVDSGGNEIWWDSITGDRRCLSLCHNRGAIFVDNRDGGDYTLTVDDTVTVESPAFLVLGEGTDSINLDIGNFLIVDGGLVGNNTTNLQAGFATDIGRAGFGVIDIQGTESSMNTGNGAMFVGVNDTGVFQVTEGASAFDTGSPRIGAGNGGIGNVNVQDPGSNWNVTGSVDVGNVVGSQGQLTVTDGGMTMIGLNLNLGGAGQGMLFLHEANVQVGNEVVIAAGSEAQMMGSVVSTLQANNIRNDGLIRILANVGADLAASVENYGTIRSEGTSNNFIFADFIHDGTTVFTDTSAAIRINGAASGAGPYTGAGTVAFRGPCNLGAGTGMGTSAAIPFAGDVQLVSSSVLNIELGGTTPGDFDQLQVNGNVSLAGSLLVHQLGGFIPGPSDRFPIVTVGSSQFGTFAGLAENSVVGNIGGVELRITYQGGDGNDVELYVGSGTLYGDVNLDGSVNLLDVGPFVERISEGQYQIEADVNMDGVVNLLDVGPFIELLSGN